MQQHLIFSDHTGDQFQALGKTQRFVLIDQFSEVQQPSELAAMVAVASAMFYDHEGRYEEENAQQTTEVRKLFDQMRALVGYNN